MSFSINSSGTLRGVRASVVANPYLPPAVGSFITSCIDELDASYNGVEVRAHGHGGAISELEITPKVFLLDPVAPPVVDPTVPPVVTDGNPPATPVDTPPAPAEVAPVVQEQAAS